MNNQETYIGLTENEFNTRFHSHKSSFKSEHKRTSTTPSDHVWKLKNKNINFNPKWEVAKKVKSFAPSDKVCKLCLQEKPSIFRSVPSLNKKAKCLDIACIRNDSILTITTIHCQLMRFPLWTETLSLDKNNIG